MTGYVRISHSQKACIQFARETAIMANADLRTNAGDGPRARPTLAQINRTLDRLQSIERLLDIALQANPEVDEVKS